MEKCKFPDGVAIKPDGVNELDPCVYEVEAEYHNVTVQVLRCTKCGCMDLAWKVQKNTFVLGVDEEADEFFADIPDGYADYMRGYLCGLNGEKPAPRRGHWIRHKEYNEEYDQYDEWCECSECGRWATAGNAFYDNETPYCPHCGAKMDESEAVKDE